MNNNYNKGEGVASFYAGSTVFITGATGFLGKVLLEKFLWSCEDLAVIYVLMRSKRGLDVGQRLKSLLECQIFRRIREVKPKVLQKIKVVYGDMSLVDLGMDAKDLGRLKEEVNVVIHSAATVRFNEDLRSALRLNTIGTKNLLEIAKEMKMLKSFVYVSTAYSNPHRRTVEETVYPQDYHHKSVIDFVDNFTDEDVAVLEKRIMGNHPNTYTLTKALAEEIVLEYSSVVPSCIVRPSIITSSWKEPYEGWVDSFSGITGIFAECGRGTITSVVCDRNCIMDLIPVDVVANTIIAAAWKTAICSPEKLKVYNCTSGSIHPIRCKDFEKITNQYLPSYPSKYITLYPKFKFRKNELLHFFYDFFYHKVPAIILDTFMYLTTRKTLMLRVGKKCWDGMDRIKYFTTKEWDFQTENMEDLIKSLGETSDSKTFNIDMSPSKGFKWNNYLKNYILGIRIYLLKDDLTSLPKARAKLTKIYWTTKIVQLLTVLYLIRVVFKFI